MDQSETATRTLHFLADSLEELLARLIPADDVLEDLIDSANDDGRPERPPRGLTGRPARAAAGGIP